MAQTYKFGNGTWATKKGSTLAYSDEGGNFKPLPFTYTGAGKGTRVNKEGLIEVVENDRPRIDYKDSEDGVFLLEKAATNKISYSEDFSQSYWIKTASTITSNATISPDGSLNADKLVENTENVAHITFASPTITLGNNTFSVFAKAAERRVLGIEFPSNGILVSFDLIDGVFVNSQANPDNFSITPYSNGWYRIDITENLTSNSIVSLSLRDDNGNRTYQGDGTSGIYIYGAMLEQSSQSSSYIPTQGTIQTRVQETASGSGNSEVFNDSQGSLFLNINTPDTSVVPVISLSNGSLSNEIEFAYYGTNQFNFILRVSGGTPNVIGNIVGGSFSKFCVTYTTTDFKVYLNGFLIGSNTLPSPLSGLNVLDFNLPNGVNNFYGKTKEVAYYDTVLTDLELETLTSYRSWEAMVKELNLNIIHNE